MTIHLVLAYHGAVFVDSAWTTAEGAARRAQAIADSRNAFKAYVQDGVKTLEIRLDESGTPVRFQIPEPEPEEYDSTAAAIEVDEKAAG